MGQSYNRAKINGTTPMDLMHMNDNFAYLWLKTFGNIDNADISDTADITGDKLKEGTITAREISADYIYAGEITAKQITGGIITGCLLKTSATVNYLQIHEQYIDTYENGNKLMDIGIVENQDGNPVIHYYKPDGTAYFSIWGNGNNFATIGGFNTNVSAEGSWDFSSITENSYPVLTSSNWSNYINTLTMSGNILYLTNGCYIECLNGRVILHANSTNYLSVGSGVMIICENNVSRNI